MSTHTGIQWTDHTFNPWWGCEKVSPACDHCYAESLAKRYGHRVWGHDAPRRFFGAKHWAEPRKWNREAEKAGVRRRVFCASMADVFEDRPDVLFSRAELWALILDTPMLDWQLLTKRPANVLRLIPGAWRVQFPPNVWIGTTAEDEHWLNVRGLAMARIPASVRFLSYEPALGELSLLADYVYHFDSRIPGVDGRRVFDWVIAGGESGSGARPFPADWARRVRDICVDAGVPFFFKQWGGFHPKAHGSELDGREWKQFPAEGKGQAA